MCVIEKRLMYGEISNKIEGEKEFHLSSLWVMMVGSMFPYIPYEFSPNIASSDSRAVIYFFLGIFIFVEWQCL